MAVRWYGDAIIAQVKVAAMKGVVKWIGLVENRWVHLLTNEPKSGRIYKRRGVAHRASAPGEPPASDTGVLVNSRRIDLFPDRLAARMTITAQHAWFLEHGTRKMEPRPSVERSKIDTLDEGRAGVAAEVAAVFK